MKCTSKKHFLYIYEQWKINFNKENKNHNEFNWLTEYTKILTRKKSLKKIGALKILHLVLEFALLDNIGKFVKIFYLILI